MIWTKQQIATTVLELTIFQCLYIAYSTSIPNFTVRRMYESAREEFEKVELLREVSIHDKDDIF
jgi:hypothetical protein